jgi:arylsulfatase A-like enzyme
MSRRAVCIYFLFLAAALWWLRAQLVTEVGVPLQPALALGLPCGLLLDLAMALLVCGAAICAGARWPAAAQPTAAALALLVLGFTAANVAYFGYFDARLEPWVIASHLRDLPAIAGSVRSLLATTALFAGVIVVPIVLIVVLLLAALRHHSRRPGVPARFGAALVAAALALGLAATAIKYRIVDGSSILAEQVFVIWIEGELGLRPLQGTARRAIERTLHDATETNAAAPGQVLATLRDWSPQSRRLPAFDDFASAAPLVRTHASAAAHTRALRARLGLPVEGPVHVIVLFLESVRAFEFEHPALGPEVFPRTRALLARHALRFSTAYSSAPGAAKTVEAQFATTCSLLPGLGGPATYIARPDLRATSLADLAREQGYHTVWISGGLENFHYKRAFESRHGTEVFFGAEYLEKMRYEGPHIDCGYPDGPMLQEAVHILERQARDGRPVFANVLTLSTHNPVSEIPEGPVPPALRAAAMSWPAQKDYVGYLSRLRYLDESLDRFFAALFDSPLADRTLVVLLGDHGQRYRPHLPIAQHQVVELMSRVPFAFVTRNQPEPGVISYPIHQIDVAPTVADIVGFRGDLPWLGRNALDGPGSPWVLAEDEQLHFRVDDHACYTLQGDDAPRCYRLDPGVDPMLSAELPAVRADPAEVRFFQWVTIAARQAIALNHIQPDVEER